MYEQLLRFLKALDTQHICLANGTLHLTLSRKDLNIIGQGNVASTGSTEPFMEQEVSLTQIH